MITFAHSLAPRHPSYAAHLGERRVQQLEEFMVANLPAIECPIRHHFDAERGVYAREIWMPSGVVITSRIHRDQHHCVLSQGEIIVFTVGGGTKAVSAPAEYLSPAGSRRAGLTVTSCLWTTYHDVGVELATSQDIEAIEELIFEPLTERQAQLVGEQRRPLAAAPEVFLLEEVA